MVWQLTGVETRNNCTAGYKAMWSKRDGFPADDYFAALDPRFEHVVDEKMSRAIAPIGDRRGRPHASGQRRWTGLRAGHGGRGRERRRARLRAGGDRDRARDDGRDHGHEQLPHRARRRARDSSRGCAASSRTASSPASSATRPGSRRSATSSPGSRSSGVPPEYHEAARRRGTDVHEVLEQEAAALRPGRERACSRSTGGTATAPCSSTRSCSGLLVGMTLATRAPEIYRALIEATAFGTRVIVDAFESAGVPVDGIVACGGLPERNKLLMQIYADVTRPRVLGRRLVQTPALGAAMFARRRRRPGSRRLRLDRRRVAADGASRREPVPAGRRTPRRLRRALPRVRPPPRPVRTRRRECDEGPATDPRRIRKDGGYRVSARALTRHRRPDDHEGAMGLDEADTTFSASR